MHLTFSSLREHPAKIGISRIVFCKEGNVIIFFAIIKGNLEVSFYPQNWLNAVLNTRKVMFWTSAHHSMISNSKRGKAQLLRIFNTIFNKTKTITFRSLACMVMKFSCKLTHNFSSHIDGQVFYACPSI